MTIAEKALNQNTGRKTISLRDCLRNYAPEYWHRLREASGRKSPTESLFKEMIAAGIIISTGDRLALKRRFADETIGVSSSGTVRIYETEVVRFLNLIGLNVELKRGV